MKYFVYILFFIFFSNCKTDLKSQVVFPEKKGYVNDFENIFTSEEKKILDKSITDFEKKTSNKILIASISTINEYEDFDKYTIDLSNFWYEDDNSITIIFSKKLRKIRINTTNKSQKTFSDEFCDEQIQKYIIPNFKEGKYFQGINTILLNFTSEWK